MTGPRADDCAEVNGPHPKHLPVCQRAGYANGRLDEAEKADAALARVEAVLARWDVLTRGESPSTAQLRAAIRGDHD